MWGLFSISHDRYQPNNNLVVLYPHKPSFEELRVALYSDRPIEKLEDFEFIIIANLLQKKEVTINIYDADFRLEVVEFGKVLDNKC